ncbi:unnamed protein product [Amoebophrya sp. A25]|nr:unnamed protein product [Amoebophrya sp. A25]|eukprot:GSA25T00022071001.1
MAAAAARAQDTSMLPTFGKGDPMALIAHARALRKQFKEQFSLNTLRERSNRIDKGDLESSRERMKLWNTGKLILDRPYWPPSDPPYGKVTKQKEFFWAFLAEQGNSHRRDLFPGRRHANDEFDDSDKAPVETDADIAKKRKKYDFSKVDAFFAMEKSVLTYEQLHQFMSHDLHAGDRVEAVKEIMYPNEGLVIPVGRCGTITKVKLDQREDFAAVEWDHTGGTRAIDMKSHYYMKKPLEVVFGFAEAPSTIQWPTSDAMQDFKPIDCTWRYRPKAEQGASIGHPESESLRLRQGFKSNTFALESSTCPKMMLALVKCATAGAGGVKDPRRLMLVDYTEKESVDRACCFKPKRVAERTIRLECCAERNIFLMLKLPNDPRVSNPFVHTHVYSSDPLFKKNSQFCICLTHKEVPKYAKTKFDVVRLNPLWVMQLEKAQGGNNNERVTLVDVSIVGESAVGVHWVPDVGKVRLWYQFRSAKDPNLMSQWVVASESAGGPGKLCATVLDTRITNGYEEDWDKVRVVVAPLARMHRFKDILSGNFYKANAQASAWINLPDSAVWKRPIAVVRKDFWESSDEEDVGADMHVGAAAKAEAMLAAMASGATSPDGTASPGALGSTSVVVQPEASVDTPPPGMEGLSRPASRGMTIPIAITNSAGDTRDSQIGKSPGGLQ